MPESEAPEFDIDQLEPVPMAADRLDVVLFDVPIGRLNSLAADARRLLAGPLQLLWFGADESERVLVRLTALPQLLVDRLLDDRHGPEGALAFVEQIPRVWVQRGYRWIGPEIPNPPVGHLLVLRPGRRDLVADPGHDASMLALSNAVGPHRSGRDSVAVEVRLRLWRGTTSDLPRLWVIRDDALGQLTAYCRTIHQQLLTRFSVAVSASAGVPCVVLRAVSIKGPPPVFVGSAVDFVPFLKWPNVYVPTHTRLEPTLRRDALRLALDIQAERVSWLHPLGDGRFRVESLPESAFAPLTDWVDFRVGKPASPGQIWSQSRRWSLEPFVEGAEKPRSALVVPPELVAPAPVVERTPIRARALNWLKLFRRSRTVTLAPEDPTIPVDEALRTALNLGDRLHHARPEMVSSAMERAQALETRFLQTLPSRIDTPAELPWAELAATYDTLANHADASLCWMNALWGQQQPSPLWAWGWLRSEAKAARPEVKVIDPSPWLAVVPGPGTTRAMAAWVVWASLQSPNPIALTERVAELQARLESHEHWLPVRAAWLARVALARAGRTDVLGLARTRDRLAERLLTAGLSLELDTPSFLRFAGEGVRERFQEARGWLADRRELIHQWLARRPEDAWVRANPADGPGPLRRVGLEPDVAYTRAYADLILAWGLSRFAEHATAEGVRRKGLAALPADDPVHGVLRDAFDFRIHQVRDGKPPRGRLPTPLLTRIDGMTGVPRYSVDKLREHSRILEPAVHVDGYWATVHRQLESTSANRTVADVSTDRLDEEVARLLDADARQRGRPQLLEIVQAAREREGDFTEAGIDRVLAVLPSALDQAWTDPRTQRRLIELGLTAAARWDRANLVRELANRVLRLADETEGWASIESLIEPTVRALRRVGLVAPAERVLDHVAERVHHGQPLGRVRADRPGEWPATLRVLLRAAAGWYAAGRDEPAHAVLDEARKDLFAAETSMPDRTALAFAYATTLGQAPVRIALGRLEEMFQRLAGIRVSGTTNTYYSLFPLLLVETAVRAVVSDDFALGPQVRAWLDADELAVRRRIRDELKAVLAAHSL